MARKGNEKRTPKVRLCQPGGRKFQLRYTCPIEQREIRISTGTHDEAEALDQKAKLEAKLLLGIKEPSKPKKPNGPEMRWDDFREAYRDLQLVTLREKSAIDAESRLAVAERIIKPRTLGDMANSDALHTLQTRLLAGAEGRVIVDEEGNRVRQTCPRSPHTVKSYMASILAALNWAVYMEWLPRVPKVRRVKVSKLKYMKGRALVGEEVDRLLDAVEKVTGAEAADSWRYLIRGLVESGLRLGELMSMSWDNPAMICPRWPRGGAAVLDIPADMQKNDTEESIPLLPGFEALLLETPEDERTGWVFQPMSLNLQHDRKVRYERLKAEWVGKVVASIGKKAGIIVEPAQPERGKEAKFASAHDLRRTCAQRLDDAGVPELDIMAVMRHRQRETLRRHYAPGSTQKTAERLKLYLGTVSKPIDVSQYTPEDSNL